MNIGDLVVEPVFDGVLKAPATAFKGTTEELWAPHRQFLDPDGMLASPWAASWCARRGTVSGALVERRGRRKLRGNHGWFLASTVAATS